MYKKNFQLFNEYILLYRYDRNIISVQNLHASHIIISININKFNSWIYKILIIKNYEKVNLVIIFWDKKKKKKIISFRKMHVGIKLA